MAHAIVRFDYQMCQFHECTCSQQHAKHIDNDNAHADALGPEQGLEARLPDQCGECMYALCVLQPSALVEWLANIRMMYAASEAQGQW